MNWARTQYMQERASDKQVDQFSNKTYNDISRDEYKKCQFLWLIGDSALKKQRPIQSRANSFRNNFQGILALTQINNVLTLGNFYAKEIFEMTQGLHMEAGAQIKVEFSNGTTIIAINQQIVNINENAEKNSILGVS